MGSGALSKDDGRAVSPWERMLIALGDVYPQVWRVKPYVLNHIVGHIPFNGLRIRLMALWGISFEDPASNAVMMDAHFYCPERVSIGADTVINRECRFDAGGGITIGRSVDISHGVRIQTGSHNIRSEEFEAIYKPVVIGDHVWVCEGAIVIGGVTIGEGAIVMAGAVVAKDVEPWAIVAGVPAKRIGTRPEVHPPMNWTADFN